MIGIFDSGSGGLTVLQALRDELPSADVIYFGDLAHAPYGEKSREEIVSYTLDAMQFLRKRGATRIISACNSVSVSMAISLFDAFSMNELDLIEMVGPTVAYFRKSDAQLGLVATPATIRSGMYQNAFRMIGKDVLCIPMPGLAPAIEQGASSEEIRRVITSNLEGYILSVDVLILACTHYPLVSDVFREVLGKNVLLFDPAYAVADRAQSRFWPQEVGNGTLHIILSADSDIFKSLFSYLFPNVNATIELFNSD